MYSRNSFFINAGPGNNDLIFDLHALTHEEGFEQVLDLFSMGGYSKSDYDDKIVALVSAMQEHSIDVQGGSGEVYYSYDSFDPIPLLPGHSAASKAILAAEDLGASWRIETSLHG